MAPQSAPLIITMGDPSGIGPEIVAKALCQMSSTGCVVAGSVSVMHDTVNALKLPTEVVPINDIDAIVGRQNTIEVLETGPAVSFPIGTVSADSGRAAYNAIVTGIDLAKSGRCSGIVTAPINKEAFAAAGIPYPGHTELLLSLGGADSVAMMLANEDIRTVLVTIHCSLREAIERADFDAQLTAIRLAHQGCQAFGVEEPRVAIAGLNPHAGENGMFGREEIDIITPAINAAQAEGIDASGPWPGDTVFMQARQGLFDVVVAQYHDQGLIPVKYMGIEDGVNITLGLPFIRTSPDHGTAFNIAGKGIADPASMVTAIKYAKKLIHTKNISSS